MVAVRICPNVEIIREYVGAVVAVGGRLLSLNEDAALILDVLTDREYQSLSSISRRLQVPVAKLHCLVDTLHDLGVLQKGRVHAL